MFRYLQPPAGASSETSVRLIINDRQVTVPAGTSVWAAMAQLGETVTRLAPLTGQARSAYCAMGVCFECLVDIDGMPNQQACLTQVADGMTVYRQEIIQTSHAIPENGVAGWLPDGTQYQEVQ